MILLKITTGKSFMFSNIKNRFSFFLKNDFFFSINFNYKIIIKKNKIVPLQKVVNYV